MVPNILHLKIGGKLIFSGEYSLLEKGLGIVGCFQEFTHFTMYFDTSMRNDVRIISERYGEECFQLDDLVKHEFVLFQKVLQILQLKQIVIKIRSDSSFQGGFGTSGACIIALTAFQMHMSNLNFEDYKQSLLKASVEILRAIYPQSSGIDIAAEIYGGMLMYDPSSVIVEPLPLDVLQNYKIIAVDCGYKTSTSTCLDIISQRHHNTTKMEILRHITSCTQAIQQAILQQNRPDFQEQMILNHQLLVTLGVCDDTMKRIVHALYDCGAEIVKISGSGLGDCILGLFDTNQELSSLLTHSVLQQYQWKELHINTKGIEMNYE